MLMQRIVLFQVWFDCTEDKNQIKILINKFINQSIREDCDTCTCACVCCTFTTK